MDERVRHRGWLAQTSIYLKKFLRMFIYQNDWKVLPMGALIAALVTFVVGANLFVTQEGTFTGAFALICVCIWNGMFNSIQVICRERGIFKREHRAGLHVFSYLLAQIIYQLLICSAQTAITLIIFTLAKVQIPAMGVITQIGMLDLAITILLVTFTSDMMALMISSIVRTTTAAMTVMPFFLIFQLIFSGGIFALEGFAGELSVLTVSRWGINGMCAVGRYNELPMVTLWNTIFKFKDVEVYGQKPLLELIRGMEQGGARDDFLLWAGTYNQNMNYASTPENLTNCWVALGILALVFILISVIALHFIDRDKR